MSKVYGTVVNASETKSGLAAARVALYTGKNQDGTYKESTMVDLVGKALAGLAVKDRVLIEVGHLDEVVFDKKDGTKGMALKGFAFKCEACNERHEAVTLRGNLVADPETTSTGKIKYRIGVNHKSKEGEKQSAFYSVLDLSGTGGFSKGDYVEVGGSLSLTLSNKGGIFRDLVAFTASAAKSEASAEEAATVDTPEDIPEDLPF